MKTINISRMSQPMNSQGSNQAASNSNYQQVLQPVNNPPPHQPRPYTQPMPGSQYQQRVGPGPHRVLTVNRYDSYSLIRKRVGSLA